MVNHAYNDDRYKLIPTTDDVANEESEENDDETDFIESEQDEDLEQSGETLSADSDSRCPNNDGVCMYKINEGTSIPYEDREVSWIKFNKRVLDLVADKNVPLLERVKFLSIANSNLDEFFSIRVASRLITIDEFDGYTGVKPIISKIIHQCNRIAADIDTAYNGIMKELADNDIIVKSLYPDTSDFINDKIKKHFNHNIKPALAPLLLDSTRPLPHIKPFCIYVVCIIKTTDGERIGLIEIPTQLDRLVHFNKYGWYFIEDIIISQISQLYPGLECSNIVSFRLLRDADTVTQTEDVGYVESMVKHVRSRILYNDPVRLEIYGNKTKKIVDILRSSLKIKKKLIFRTSARLKMADIIELYNASNNPNFKYPEFRPAPFITEDISFMDMINRKDYIIHHPYESFNNTVLKLIKEACSDPHVIAIKQTLYRSGEDSKVLKYLLRAAESGKSVVVVMELKARFDEETNIEWADKLQRAGATVVYGYEQIKTHAKLLHIFRKDGKNVSQYCHIGTGNYSEKNSKIYTDFSYFTSNIKICSDVNNIFNTLTGGFISDQVHYNRIKVAPMEIRPMLYSLIDGEIAKGENGYIAIKVNNISDHQLVSKLYSASQAGVKIDIICRGSCSLIAGYEGFSENIRVISIVGRFLEHSRVLIFGKDEYSRVFITSSDLMTRNLDRRLEILFEVTPVKLKDYLMEYVGTMLHDTANAYEMGCDGVYHKLNGDFNSQEYLIKKHAEEANCLGE